VPPHLTLSELHPGVPALVTPFQERLSYGKHNNDSHGWSLLNFPHDGHEAIGTKLFDKSWYFRANLGYSNVSFSHMLGHTFFNPKTTILIVKLSILLQSRIRVDRFAVSDTQIPGRF